MRAFYVFKNAAVYHKEYIAPYVFYSTPLQTSSEWDKESLLLKEEEQDYSLMKERMVSVNYSAIE